jgi:fatty acid/phospholipid biosynthesis enzyme
VTGRQGHNSFVPGKKEASALEIAEYVNKGSQWSLAAAVTRILVRAAAAVTALGLGCTAAVAAHTFPVAPILGLMARKQANAAVPQAVRNDALAESGANVEVEAEEMCGYSILDGQPIMRLFAGTPPLGNP